jgi:CRISPR-associated exonuclease Cas4
VPFDDDELLPLAALQHMLFCERQCALIHIERAWEESVLTIEGRALHERADEEGVEVRGELRVARGVPLRSLRLGIVGKADIVEFRRGESGPTRLRQSGQRPWTPFPVEYKRGNSKRNDCDRVQLCAQALCLEEMLTVSVPSGALFYGRTRRREEVSFDGALRTVTEGAVRRLRALIAAAITPSARREPKCGRCSLLEVCRPDAIGRDVRAYLLQTVLQP